MANHTPEPWAVWEETAYDNDGFPETVIKGLNGRAGIAVTIDFGPNNPGMREANARRIVACVNACVGVSDDALDGGWEAAGLSAYAKRLEVDLAAVTAQRDELLAALKQYADDENWCYDTCNIGRGEAKKAIAKCEVQNA